jgi:hypothetical protein
LPAAARQARKLRPEAGTLGVGTSAKPATPPPFWQLAGTGWAIFGHRGNFGNLSTGISYFYSLYFQLVTDNLLCYRYCNKPMSCMPPEAGFH